MHFSILFSKHIKGKGKHSRDSFEIFEVSKLFVHSYLHLRNQNFKNLIFLQKMFDHYEQLHPRRIRLFVILGINNEEDANKVFPKDSLILDDG